MLITAKTEIKGIRMELSIADAKEVLRNPKKVQTEIRVILEHYKIDVPTATDDKPPVKPFKCVCGKDYLHKSWMEKHQKSCEQFKLAEDTRREPSY